MNNSKIIRRSICIFFACTAFSSLYSQEPAQKLIAEAISQAKKENKNVFVKFTASWCRWCKVLDSNMKSETCGEYFMNNYVIVTLTANDDKIQKMLAEDMGKEFVSQENPGATELLIEYGSKKEGVELNSFGMPFWFILNGDGDLIEDAFDDNGENIAYPSADQMDIFIAKLKNTSDIDEDEIAAIHKTFVKD